MNWRPHAVLKPPTDAEMAKMEPEELVRLHELYHEAILNSERDPYRYGFIPENWNRADKLLGDRPELLVLGGNRCLASEQEILGAGKIGEIDGPTEVFAYDNELDGVVRANASRPFRKDRQKIFRVTFDNGQTLLCSAAHQVLTLAGWQEVGSLTACSPVVALERGRLSVWLKPVYWLGRAASILGSVREAFLLGERRLIQKPQDFLSGCPACRHFCDEPPPALSGCAQGAAPSPIGVPECSCPDDNNDQQNAPPYDCLRPRTRGGQAGTPEHIHVDPVCGHRATLGALARILVRFAGTLSHAFCKPCKLALRLLADLGSLRGSPLSVAGFLLWIFCRQFPVLGREFYRGLAFGYNRQDYCFVKSVCFLRHDYVWDIEVPGYWNYIAGGVVNHNSAKTSYSARSVVKAAIDNPGAIIFCFAQNADVSIRQQQNAVFDWLPEEYKKKIKDVEASISYTRKNGFTKASLILPDSNSQIIFKTYSQFLNNDTILEGAELGSKEPKWINIGAWLDEYLIGPELINTLRFRLATRNAKMLVTFTPIDGYTEVVRDYIAGANTVETREAALLNNERVPSLQQSANRNANIIYFHTIDNPFGGYERIVEDLKKRPREEILVRAYGVPVKSISTRFPSFSREVNVVKHDSIPTEGVTRYLILDPAGRKKWFMAWIAVDASDTWWVYREWPDQGVWAKWVNGKWAAGDAAKPDGMVEGVKQYVDLITGLESPGREAIFERLIDPRMGAAKYQGQLGVSSIIEDLEDAGLSFIPAPGLHEEDGLQALRNKMAYDTSRPIDAVNRPHMYVSERCQNIIQAIQEYNPEENMTEPWKDPIDVLRYAAIDGIRYVPSTGKAISRRNGGY